MTRFFVDLRDADTDYSPAMVRITIETAERGLATGSGFHIGNGLIVTARHVLYRGTVKEIVSQYAQRSTEREIGLRTHLNGGREAD